MSENLKNLSGKPKINLDDPVEISGDSYWVGRREGTLLERNIFLRVFKRGGRSVNLIIDPGPPEDLVPMSQKVGKIIENLRKVNLVFLNHQDPDVCYNSGYLQKMNPNLLVLCSEDTWRLVRFYGLSSKNYRPVEKFKNLTVSLATGHVLSFIPTPFCHFRGATMIYDHETRILYTGDLFGGLSYKSDLYADESSWDGMKTFHQIYMPVQEGLKLAVKNIRALDPKPVMLAPQHGSIITGKWVDYYLDKIESLPVGLNLLLDSQQKDNYLVGMNELLAELSPFVDEMSLRNAMRVFAADGTFPNIIKADGLKVLDIKIDLETAVSKFVQALTQNLPDHRDMIEMVCIKVLLGRNIPLPEMFSGEVTESPEFFDVD